MMEEMKKRQVAKMTAKSQSTSELPPSTSAPSSGPTSAPWGPKVSSVVRSPPVTRAGHPPDTPASSRPAQPSTGNSENPFSQLKLRKTSGPVNGVKASFKPTENLRGANSNRGSRFKKSYF